MSRAERPSLAARLGGAGLGELREVRMNQHSSGITVRLEPTLLPCFDVGHSGISNPATLLIREYACKHGCDNCLTTHSLLFPDFLHRQPACGVLSTPGTGSCGQIRLQTFWMRLNAEAPCVER